MHKRWLLSSIAILLVGLGIMYQASKFYAPTGRSTGGPKKSATAPPQGSSQSAGTGVGASANAPAGANAFHATAASSAALPAEQEPLAKAYPELKRAALQGNVEAGCRLAVQLQWCANARSALNSASLMMQDAFDPARHKAMADQALKLNESFGPQCDGVTPAMFAEAYRFQAIAADSGAKPYVRWIATHPVLNEQDFLGQLDDWADYRRRAVAYAQAALAARDGQNLLWLLHAYAPEGTLVPRPPYKPYDDVVFLALFDIAQRRGVTVPGALIEAAGTARQSLTTEGRAELAKKIGEFAKGFSNTGNEDYDASFMPPEDSSEFCRQ